MGQVLHGSATTTEAVRRTIQFREESVRALARRYGVSPTTVQTWRRRTTTADARMGPQEPRSTVLTVEEEAIIIAFRRHMLLPLDDCLYGLQPADEKDTAADDTAVPRPTQATEPDNIRRATAHRPTVADCCNLPSGPTIAAPSLACAGSAIHCRAKTSRQHPIRRYAQA